jgi:zinc protease
VRSLAVAWSLGLAIASVLPSRRAAAEPLLAEDSPALAAASRKAVTGFAEITRLSSGLRLVLHAEPGTGTVAVCSLFPAGLARDGTHRGELSQIVAETVREGGRRSRDAEYSRVLESRGARSSAFLGNARAEFCTEAPAHELSLALWLESGRHRPYAFTELNFDERRRELALGQADDPFELLQRKTYALAFPELAPEGSAAAGSLLDAARRFHAQYYRLDRAVLTIAGDFEPSLAKAKVDEWFADPAPGAPPPEDKPVPRQTSPRFMSLEDRNLTTPVHARAWVVPGAGNPDHAALRLAAELLASNTDSLLYDMLLETGVARGLAHRFESRGPEDLFSITITLAGGQNATDLVALVDQAVMRLASGPLRPEQLVRARQRLAVRRAFTLQRALDQARWLGQRASLGLALSPGDEQTALDAVEPADVRRVVLAHLAETRRVVVELLPKEARESFRVATPRFHVVTEGEALSRIARREGTTVNELLKLNELDAKGRIRPGQKLKLPPGKPLRVHVVKKGETLIGIAKRYGVGVDVIRSENRLKKGGVIRAGEQLKIPREAPGQAGRPGSR